MFFNLGQHEITDNLSSIFYRTKRSLSLLKQSLKLTGLMKRIVCAPNRMIRVKVNLRTVQYASRKEIYCELIKHH